MSRRHDDMGYVLDYLEDILEVLREIKRLLSEGGADDE
jgi:ubiquinone/menaquinone biosynthesis C-methylase UbiE